jgi:hypothetical protein
MTSAGLTPFRAPAMLISNMAVADQLTYTAVQLLRITMVSPGVTTVKGWRVNLGAGTQDSLPDFFFVVLVKR